MRQVPVYDGQSFLDISLQEYGTAEGVFHLCEANGQQPDDLPVPGTMMNIPDFPATKNDVARQVFQKAIIPVTLKLNAGEEGEETDKPEGINYWGIEEDFIVQPNPGDPEE